jgi:hypothetical protein
MAVFADGMIDPAACAEIRRFFRAEIRRFFRAEIDRIVADGTRFIGAPPA